MKLFLVCMIRNEIDILPEFLGHIDNLFDSGCLVDHLSSDGSELLLREFTSTRSSWEYQPLKTPAYVQAEKSSELLHCGFKNGADAVFFLDADEFIASVNRASLEEAVAAMNANKLVGQMRWRNCVPGEYGTFSLDKPVWLCDLSPHRKLAVPCWLYGRYGERFGMNQGNHSLRVSDGGTFPAANLGEILHFPIRSREQFIRKTLVSYVSQAIRPAKIVAPHIRILFNAMLRHELSPEMLNALAVNYGAAASVDQPLNYAEMEKRGYRLEHAHISRNHLEFSTPLRSIDSVIDFGDILEYQQATDYPQRVRGN